jgi:hypothetical protein
MPESRRQNNTRTEAYRPTSPGLSLRQSAGFHAKLTPSAAYNVGRLPGADLHQRRQGSALPLGASGLSFLAFKIPALGFVFVWVIFSQRHALLLSWSCNINYENGNFLLRNLKQINIYYIDSLLAHGGSYRLTTCTIKGLPSQGAALLFCQIDC